MKQNIPQCRKKKTNIISWSLLLLFLTVLGLNLIPNHYNCFSKHFDSNGLSGYQSITPRDPYFSSSWHLTKIEADKGWEITTGTNLVSVGVIDSGIDNTLVDLQDNVDVLLGHDCYSPERNAQHIDTNGHGTMVSSVLGARGDNDTDISGVCWNVSLVSLKNENDYYNPNGSATVTAIEYAALHDIPIVNLSSIFTDDSYLSSLYSIDLMTSGRIYDMETSIMQYDGLLVACAGNQGTQLSNNTDYYPQTFTENNIIVVGGSDEFDQPVSSSNYSSTIVDLFAPSVDLKALPYNQQTNQPCSFSGTSAAAPLVAGTAALMKSVNPNLTATQIKQLIINNVDYSTYLNGKCVSNGRLNTYKSLLAAIPEYCSFGTAQDCVSILAPNQHQFYKVVLQPGTYTFKSLNADNLQCYLYSDIQFSPIQSSNDHAGNYDFVYSTTIARTIYFKVVNNSLNNDEYKIKVDYGSTHSHSYSDGYRYYNSSYHKAFCQCGSYLLKPHIYESGNLTNCIVCGIQNLDPLLMLRPYTIVGNGSRLLNDGTLILSSLDVVLFKNNQTTYEELLGESNNE